MRKIECELRQNPALALNHFVQVIADQRGEKIACELSILAIVLALIR